MYKHQTRDCKTVWKCPKWYSCGPYAVWGAWKDVGGAATLPVHWEGMARILVARRAIWLRLVEQPKVWDVTNVTLHVISLIFLLLLHGLNTNVIRVNQLSI